MWLLNFDGFSELLLKNTLSAISIDKGPLIRTMPMPFSPGGVDIAAIVSFTMS